MVQNVFNMDGLSCWFLHSSNVSWLKSCFLRCLNGQNSNQFLLNSSGEDDDYYEEEEDWWLLDQMRFRRTW
jgi:hypothetical protein